MSTNSQLLGEFRAQTSEIAPKNKISGIATDKTLRT